jgi:hypothetical protein
MGGLKFLFCATVAGLAIAAFAPSVQADALWPQVPNYPGSTRPLPRWEASRLAIAQSNDSPLQVLAFYADRLPRLGWTPQTQTVPEAAAAIAAGAPAWISYTHPRQGRLDLQIHAGPHPKTGNMVTLIFYETTRAKN